MPITPHSTPDSADHSSVAALTWPPTIPEAVLILTELARGVVRDGAKINSSFAAQGFCLGARRTEGISSGGDVTGSAVFFGC